MKKLAFFALMHFIFYTASAQQRVEIPSSSTNTNLSNLSTSELEALDYHNKVRAEVGVEKLQWSDELAEYAKSWAQKLASDGCSLKHRTASDQEGKSYGENIAWSSASDYTLLDASKAWYSEIQYFQNVVLNETNWYESGHYSQMVWRDTKKVGIATAKCAQGGTIVVANYDPSGNYMGEKAY